MTKLSGLDQKTENARTQKSKFSIKHCLQYQILLFMHKYVYHKTKLRSAFPTYFDEMFSIRCREWKYVGTKVP